MRARVAPHGRRERSITVETAGLGVVRVRRVTLGGIARCADRLRAEGGVDDEALVDALIGEVTVLGAEAGGGARRRPDAAQLGQLTDDDRRSIAAAVLTLEGVKAAGEGIVQHPLTALALRYGPMVGLGDRGRPRPVALDLPEVAAAAAPHDAHHLPGDDAISAEPEPQIPLFERGELPSVADHRLPDPDAASPVASRAARAAAERSRAHQQALLDEQQRTLLELADDHRALADEVTALAARAERAEAAARRHRWIVAGAAALALAIALGQAFVAARRERALTGELQALQAQVKQQGDALGELRAAAARGDRAPAVRAAPGRKPAKAPAPQGPMRTGSGR